MSRSALLAAVCAVALLAGDLRGEESTVRKHRTARSLATLMVEAPAAVRPLFGESWSDTVMKRVSNWASNQDVRLDTLAKVRTVAVDRLTKKEQQKHSLPQGWKAVISFDKREYEWQGVTLEETVQPVVLIGAESLIRSAEKLGAGKPVRVVGQTRHVAIHEISDKRYAVQLHHAGGEILSNAIRRTEVAKATPGLSEDEIVNIGPRDKGWQTRLWGGKRWAPRPLSSMKADTDGEALVVKQTTGRDVAFLTYEDRTLKSDFHIILTVSGSGAVGLLRDDGKLHGRMAAPFKSDTPVTVEIIRDGREIRFEVNGEEVEPTAGKDAEPGAIYNLAIAMGINESVTLHSVKIRKE